MKKPVLPGILFRNLLIVILLLGLILAPRPAAGYLDVTKARRFASAGNYTDTALAYQTAAQRLPWEASLWEKAGQAALDGKDYARAEYYYGTAHARQTLSPAGMISWGDALFALGDPKAALVLWNGQMDNAGDPSLLLPRIARAYRALALYSDEMRAWQKYLVNRPGDASAHYRLGLLLAATAPAEALPELMLALRSDTSLDAPVQALRSALNTASISDDQAYQFVVSGRALGAVGEWDLAARAFQNAIAMRADYAEAWAWLSEAKQQQGQAGTAEMDRALALKPDSAMLQSLYGLYLQRRKQPQQALSAFQKAAALEPGNPGWQMALGQAYEQTGDLVTALAHYQSAVALSPNDATFWRALVEFSLRNNVDLSGTGLPAVLRLVELANADWQSDDLAGQILMETGDLVGAEALLQKAIQLDPTQAAPCLHLGLLYLQTGDRAGAYSYLNQAKTFDPDGSIGWQANRLLEQYFP